MFKDVYTWMRGWMEPTALCLTNWHFFYSQEFSSVQHIAIVAVLYNTPLKFMPCTLLKFHLFTSISLSPPKITSILVTNNATLNGWVLRGYFKKFMELYRMKKSCTKCKSYFEQNELWSVVVLKCLHVSEIILCVFQCLNYFHFASCPQVPLMQGWDHDFCFWCALLWRLVMLSISICLLVSFMFLFRNIYPDPFLTFQLLYLFSCYWIYMYIMQRYMMWEPYQMHNLQGFPPDCFLCCAKPYGIA